MINNEVPSIGHLRVFGCGAYVHLPALGRERKEDIWQEIPNIPQGNEQMVPGPSSPTSRDRYHDAPLDTESQLAKLTVDPSGWEITIISGVMV